MRLTLIAGALTGLALTAAVCDSAVAQMSLSPIRPEFTRPGGMPGQPRMIAATGTTGELMVPRVAPQKPVRRHKSRRRH